MGRPMKPLEERRSKKMTTDVSPLEIERYRAGAQRAGRSLSRFTREALDRACEGELLLVDESGGEEIFEEVSA